MTTRQLRDEFRRVHKFPILTEDVAFIALVRKGVSDGVFIYREGANQITGPGDPLSAVHINDNCFVMTMDYAKAKHFWPRPEPLKVCLKANPTTVAPGSTVELTVEVSGGVGPYVYNSSIPAFQHSAATTQNVLSTRVSVDATKTFSVEVIDHLGNKQPGSVWVQVSKGAERTTVVDFIPPPPKPPAGPELTAEGPLVTVLKEIWDKARRAKVEKIQSLKITMHDSHAVWKVHGAMVIEKTAAISCDFNLEMTAEGVETLTVNFTGAVDKSANIRSFLEPVMKQASHKDFQATYSLRFSTGLNLSGSDPEKLTENLTKFGGTEAYVEAHVEDEQKEVAA